MTNQHVPDSHTDLLQSPLATLATVGRDGLPQLSTVWFLEDDGKVRVSLNTERQKTKNLMDNPAICVHIQDTVNPVRYLELRGTAEVEPDPDYVFANRIGAKYGVEDIRVFDGGKGSRVVVTVDPKRINAIDLSAGGEPRKTS